MEAPPLGLPIGFPLLGCKQLRLNLRGPPGKEAMSRGAPVRLHKAPSATIRTARPTMASVTVASKGFFKIDSHSSCRQAVQAPLGDRLPPPPQDPAQSCLFQQEQPDFFPHSHPHSASQGRCKQQHRELAAFPASRSSRRLLTGNTGAGTPRSLACPPSWRTSLFCTRSTVSLLLTGSWLVTAILNIFLTRSYISGFISSR